MRTASGPTMVILPESIRTRSGCVLTWRRRVPARRDASTPGQDTARARPYAFREYYHGRSTGGSHDTCRRAADACVPTQERGTEELTLFGGSKIMVPPELVFRVS